MLSIFRRSLILLTGFSFLGAVGTQFLTVPASAQELALGAHVTAPSLNIVNPALLTIRNATPEINFTYGRWLADSRTSTFYAAWSTRFGYGGLRARYLETRGLELRTDTPTDVPLAQFGAFGVTVEGLASWKLGRLTVGSALRLITMEVYTESSTGFAMDIGINQAVTKNLMFGASLLNLGAMSPLENQSPELPLRLLIGGSYQRETPTFSHTLLVTGEWSSQVPGGILLIGGSTQWQRLTIQLSTRLSRKVVAIGSGFGFRWGIYQLYYGIQFGSQGLGLPQSLDIAIQLP
jgi:hypothetical protein